MANKLKEIRQSRNMSVSELARRSNLTRQTVHRLEKEEDANVNIETLKLLADVLNVRLIDLI